LLGVMKPGVPAVANVAACDARASKLPVMASAGKTPDRNAPCPAVL
jgi:hypothetical protein